MRRSAVTALLAVLALLPLATGCSSDTADDAKSAVESAKDDAAETVDDASARGQAEALRASLKGNDTADEEGVRSVAAIRQAAEDLPGDPEVTGVEDGDGDGLDDDGKVQITVGGSSACVSLPETGGEIDVSGGEC